MTRKKIRIPLVQANEDWKVKARCKGIDPELFFPARGYHQGTTQAIAVCRLCAVREQCLDYALRNREKFGVFGGKSDRARRTWRRQLRVTNAAFEADIYPVVDELASWFVSELEVAS